ncbi:N-formylglutamate amidohydrolase [Kiloniella sp. b19]|uniref:N-formylglutamate amidohydrolase n=1 Tax=Kiloniella sp. GXU_MW_B19 TaxID=3141326 RepID=UPI0031DBC47E
MSLQELSGGQPSLLAADEPAPFRIVNQDSPSNIVFFCDHASNFVPRSLNGLGMSGEDMQKHIAYDIGIRGVTEILAERFGFCAIYSHFSRLVVDPNRKLDHDTLIPPVSDGIEVPGNRDLSVDEEQARMETFYYPYQAALKSVLDGIRGRGQVPAILSMHSMTHEMDGVQRPWPVCALWNRDPRLAVPFMEAFKKRDILCGDNVPYDGRDGHGNSIEVHGDGNGYANMVIEVRQDLISDEQGIRHWAAVLGDVFAEIVDNPELNEVRHYCE